MSDKMINLFLAVITTLFLKWCWEKIQGVVINSDQEVLFPKVKIKLVKRSFESRDDLISYCGAMMIKAGYGKEDVTKFLVEAKKAQDIPELLSYCYQCFYIY